MGLPWMLGMVMANHGDRYEKGDSKICAINQPIKPTNSGKLQEVIGHYRKTKVFLTFF